MHVCPLYTGRYKDAAHKAKQFPIDCHGLATAQHIYANQLKALGVVDEVIWERGGGSEQGSEEGGVAVETYKDFPILKQRVLSFITRSLATLSKVRNLPLYNDFLPPFFKTTLIFCTSLQHLFFISPTVQHPIFFHFTTVG